ncbi:hypothetical protein Poli38472_001767 [Pythium oligandrum]|uniref:subtilisin n=1 Tax=Pythium oligandrum TaxID=41045 RepID=A0A8K1CVY9_PYTOL|nr:hypothetical protein Poli38472_001767 [Pythium oligandrum]|eukprot:TMW69611.1 hypothetical protein Poli38472_001767 [Pythium oligandrum]
MVATNFAPLLLVTALLASDVSAARVDPGVHRTLRQQKTVNLIVTMKKGTQESIKAVKEASFTSRGALIEDMVSRLQKNAESSQSELSGLFAKEAAGEYGSSKSFWISNQLYVDGATVEFLERLAASPSVGEIREENIFEVPEIQAAAAAPANSSASGISWGVEMIKAPVVWAKGNTGEGVVVGNIDTGVLAIHEARSARLAPGVDIRSAWYSAVDVYTLSSGTSMATPHVTGAVALLLAAKPGLKFEAVRDILTKSADTESLMPSGYSCGNTTDGVFPNNMYGYGRRV